MGTKEGLELPEDEEEKCSRRRERSNERGSRRERSTGEDHEGAGSEEKVRGRDRSEERGLQEERRVQRNLREEEDTHLPRTPPQKIVEGLVVGKRLILIKLIKTLKAQ